MSADAARALIRAEEALRARGLTGGQAFDALVDAIEARLDDEPVDADTAVEAVADLDPNAGLDLLGLAYERFFADLFKGRRGQYFTPRPLVELLLDLGGVKPGVDVLDPTCGSGGFAVCAARRGAKVRGIELDPNLARLARLNLRLAGFDGKVDQADFFATEARPADVVVANPPFSVPIVDPEVLGRYELGQGHKRVLSDWLFVEALEHWVRPGGRAAIVFPWSILDNPSTEPLRDRIARHWRVESIVALPEGVFRPFGGAAGRAVLMVLERGGTGFTRWAEITDPGWDVRSVHLKATPGADLAALRAGRGWRWLPVGSWMPGPSHSGRRVSDLASSEPSSVRPARDLDGSVGLAELADGDRRTGELHPRDVAVDDIRGGRLRLREGDVLVARMRPELGNVVVAPEGDNVGSPEVDPVDASCRRALAAARAADTDLAEVPSDHPRPDPASDARGRGPGEPGGLARKGVGQSRGCAVAADPWRAGPVATPPGRAAGCRGPLRRGGPRRGRLGTGRPGAGVRPRGVGGLDTASGGAMRWVLASLLLLGACKKDDPTEGSAYDGVLDLGLNNPWPNVAMLDGNGNLDIPADIAGSAPAPDPSRLAWRTGFSPSQTGILRLPGIDDSDFPRADALRPGEGSVRLLDLTDGAWLPVMAELDAHPDAAEPALIIRPMVVLPQGHDIAMVVTTGAMNRLDSFDALVNDDAPGNDDLVKDTTDLVDAIEAAGLSASEIAVAWQFPVDDPRKPLQSAMQQLDVPGTWRFQITRDRDNGDAVVPTAWRTATGKFDVQDFLVDDKTLNMAADGSVSPTGTAEAHLYVHIPESVRDAPAESVPVLIFGHGIFANPELYLDEQDDPSNLVNLANEAGFIVVGTRWRGLTSTDVVEVVAAANDFSTFATVPERLVQGQVNTRTLIELVHDGAFFDDPLFVGDSGQKLPMDGRAVYYGISLGSIEGAILLANDAPVDAAALHVGGAMWSTMLERSSNWTTFEDLMVTGVPEPSDRQLLYSISQLWWDFADPASFAPDLVDKPMLYQYSLGDEQVPNMTSEALARSIGLPVLTPNNYVPFGLETTSPTGPGSRAMVQLDPEVPPPSAQNRPAEVSGAHTGPRQWDGVRDQIIDHLTLGSEGQVVHHCGAAICSESNQGN